MATEGRKHKVDPRGHLLQSVTCVWLTACFRKLCSGAHDAYQRSGRMVGIGILQGCLGKLVICVYVLIPSNQTEVYYTMCQKRIPVVLLKWNGLVFLNNNKHSQMLRKMAKDESHRKTWLGNFWILVFKDYTAPGLSHCIQWHAHWKDVSDCGYGCSYKYTYYILLKWSHQKCGGRLLSNIKSHFRVQHQP